jgi:hypothetical protein
MQRTFIKGCCPICDGYKRHIKSTRNGARKVRKLNKALHRKFRRMMLDRLVNGDYEPVFLSYERWF